MKETAYFSRIHEEEAGKSRKKQSTPEIE